MTKIEYTRTRKRADFLAGFVTGALEGAIGYWAAAETYRWYDPSYPPEDNGSAEPGPDNSANAYAELVPDDPHDTDHWPVDKNGEKRFLLDLDAVDKVLKNVRLAPIPNFRAARLMWADYTEDHCEANLDAEDYDVVAQLAAFGEVIYG